MGGDASRAPRRRRVRIPVEDMVCSGCEEAVEQALRALPGVAEAHASRAHGEAVVELAAVSGATCGRADLVAAIEKAGYSVPRRVRPRVNPGVWWIAAALVVYLLAWRLGLQTLFSAFPTVGGQGAGFAALFSIGLLTSVHCVAMCGGFNIGQTLTGTAEHPLRHSLLYNLGRLTSYTAVGALLGLVGGALAITLGVRAAIGLAAGVVMVGMAVCMLCGFAPLARVKPRLPRRLAGLLDGLRSHGPFAIGLANGFMPCGPLQAMQLYAVASGSLLAGALSMFSFCLGTVPLVLLVGAAAGLLRKGFRRAMLRVGATLLLVFGLFMLQNNLTLLGVLPGSVVAATSQGAGVAVAVVENDAAASGGQVQRVTTHLRPNGYDGIQVAAGIPVEWTIEAEASDVNGCNNQFVVPAFGLTVDLAAGETVVRFTPDEPGVYPFSCWMGMLSGTITVV